MTKKYLDSNVFIYPLLYEDDKAIACKEIMEALINKNFEAYTSVLCWDEFVYILRKERGKETAVKEGEKFLKFPHLLFLDARKSVLFKAQQLMEEYKLKPRDAIHAATAILNHINEIISDDGDFDAVKEIKRIPLGKFTR